MMAKIRADQPAPYQEGGYALRVVSMPGRKSGKPRPLPVAVPMVAGDLYLCAPNRRRDWVRNLLTAGECEIEADPVPRYRAVLLEDSAAAIAVHAYLTALDRTSAEWPFPAGASVAEITPYVAEIAVFRLEPVTG
jgi:hypothetical protein